MLSGKGQCKWTCRLTPFRIAFILLHHLVILVNTFSFIWAKTYFPCIAQVSYFIVFGCKIYTHERREHYATRGCLLHQAMCLVCFESSALINYSLILAYHQITCLFSTNSATNLRLLLTEFIPGITMPFSIKKILKNFTAIYSKNFLCVYHLVSLAKFTHQRSEHIPGVQFCKYLLVNLLTGQHVCFSYFAFIFSPLSVLILYLIFYHGLCAYRGCLTGLNVH